MSVSLPYLASLHHLPLPSLVELFAQADILGVDLTKLPNIGMNEQLGVVTTRWIVNLNKFSQEFIEAIARKRPMQNICTVDRSSAIAQF